MLLLMPQASDIHKAAFGVSFWQVYDSQIKADLYSTVIETAETLCLIDPIPLAPAIFDQLVAIQKVAGIFVTNSNHFRAATGFANALSSSIYLHHSLIADFEFPRTISVRDNQELAGTLVAITLDGGPCGEIALHCPDHGGTVVFGDALINFEPYGFGILPPKYCTNPKQLRQSLCKLLNYSFERMFFAHGPPILKKARARVEALLDHG
jgi:hypothetical protein